MKLRPRTILFSAIGLVLVAGVVAYLVWRSVTLQGYWDGAAYPGQPVYDQTHGISRTLERELQKCGISDADAISDFQQLKDLPPNATFPVTVSNVGSNGQQSQSVSINVVGPGVYSLTC